MRYRNAWAWLQFILALGVLTLVFLLIVQIGYLVWNLIEGKVLVTEAGVLGSTDKFEVFRDVLLIVMGLMAVIGIGGWRVLEHRVREDLSVETRETVSNWVAHTNLSLSQLYYLQEPKPENKQAAIIHARWALAEVPDKERLSRLNELWRMRARNNLCYFLSWQHRQEPHPDDKPEAVRLADEVLKAYNSGRTDFKSPEFLETYWYVRASFAESREEAQEIKSEVEKLLAANYLASIHARLKETLAFLSLKGLL